jgi:hypothetical protein
MTTHRPLRRALTAVAIVIYLIIAVDIAPELGPDVTNAA